MCMLIQKSLESKIVKNVIFNAKYKIKSIPIKSERKAAKINYITFL